MLKNGKNSTESAVFVIDNAVSLTVLKSMNKLFKVEGKKPLGLAPRHYAFVYKGDNCPVKTTRHTK